MEVQQPVPWRIGRERLGCRMTPPPLLTTGRCPSPTQIPKAGVQFAGELVGTHDRLSSGRAASLLSAIALHAC